MAERPFRRNTELAKDSLNIINQTKKNVKKYSPLVVWSSFKANYHHLQTLERAFLQLCESSDKISSKRGSSPQEGPLENSQSFESGKDESKPILGVTSGPAEEIPKYSGASSDTRHNNLISHSKYKM